MQMNYNNKANLVGAMLVAGYDKLNGGQVRDPLQTVADRLAAWHSMNHGRMLVVVSVRLASLCAAVPALNRGC